MIRWSSQLRRSFQKCPHCEHSKQKRCTQKKPDESACEQHRRETISNFALISQRKMTLIARKQLRNRF